MYSNALQRPMPRNDMILHSSQPRKNQHSNINIHFNHRSQHNILKKIYTKFLVFNHNTILLILVTAARRNVSNADADERTEAGRRDQITLSRTFATTNDIPTRGTTEQEFTSFGSLILFLDLLLNF